MGYRPIKCKQKASGPPLLASALNNPDHDLQQFASMKPRAEQPEIFPQKSPEIQPPSREDPEIDEPPRRHSPEISPEPSPDATPPQPSRSPEISPPERHIQPIREPIPAPVHPEN